MANFHMDPKEFVEMTLIHGSEQTVDRQVEIAEYRLHLEILVLL